MLSPYFFEVIYGDFFFFPDRLFFILFPLFFFSLLVSLLPRFGRMALFLPPSFLFPARLTFFPPFFLFDFFSPPTELADSLAAIQ